MIDQNYKHRNPLIITPMGNFLQTIGDTHLGRVFKNDVPLERRGDYEQLQHETLQKLLWGKPSFTNTEKLLLSEIRGRYVKVQVGDWFDKPIVSLNVIQQSVDTLEQYAQEHEHKENLFILSGNHDDAKNITDTTAWDLLASTLRSSVYNLQETVTFVKDYEVYEYANGEEILFIGWNIATNTCAALLGALEKGHKSITTVVCHLDKISYGNDENVIPYEFFASHGIKLVVSGHEHKPYLFHDSGMEIIGTGSLLPFSHAEDDGEEIYVTLHSINEYEDYLINNDVSEKHIRLILDEVDQKRVDELTNIDSYSLKIVKKGVAVEVLDMDNSGVSQVTLEAYDAKTVWENAVAETGLEPITGKLVWSEIQSKGVEE